MCKSNNGVANLQCTRSELSAKSYQADSAEGTSPRAVVVDIVGW